MKKKVVCLILMMLISGFLKCQREAVIKLVDSLILLAPKLQDTKRADAYYQISLKYFDQLEEAEKSFLYAKQAREISEKINYNQGKAQSYYILARLKDYDRNLDEACQLFFNSLMALNVAKKNSLGKYDQIILPQNDPELGKLIGDINFHFGVSLIKKFNFSSGVDRYLRSLQYYEISQKILETEFLECMKANGQTVTPENFSVKIAQDYLTLNPTDKKAGEISEKSSEVLSGIRYVCMNLGTEFSKINDNIQAGIYFKKALANAESVGAKLSYLKILKKIGHHYMTNKEFDSAIVYLRKLHQNALLQKALPFLADANQALGYCHSQKGEKDFALTRYQFIDSLLEPLRNGTYEGNPLYSGIGKSDAENLYSIQLAINRSNIGDIYYENPLTRNKGIVYYKKSIEIFKPILPVFIKQADTMRMVRAKQILGELYSKIGQHEKGIQYLLENVKVFEKSEDIEGIYETYELLYECYDRKNDPAKALFFYKRFNVLKDSIKSNLNVNEIGRLQKRFEVEKKDDTIELLNKSKEAQASELEKQKLVRNGFIGGFLVLTILAFVIFRSLQQNKKAKKTIEHQKELVEEKNKEITDSITYAKRLQDAILPPEKFVKENLPGTFILYKPKDIVAGDFYWAEKIKNNFYIAAADCTGHGVPGAMVSVVCSNALNRAVKEFNLTETGKILDKVRELVIETFEKSDKDVKDGMDISLLSIESHAPKEADGMVRLQWSGANNPLWYIEDNELKEITANKQPIGKFDNEKPFTTHTLKLKSNSALFLFTDGYADQFGGPKGKKFKYKQFAEILIQNVSKSPQEQSDILNNRFEKWKENVEQVDDVCIIGIKL